MDDGEADGEAGSEAHYIDFFEGYRSLIVITIPSSSDVLRRLFSQLGFRTQGADELGSCQAVLHSDVAKQDGGC